MADPTRSRGPSRASLAVLLVAVSGCEYGFTLPSADPAFDGRRRPGLRLPLRERRTILPGTDTSMPPPEAGILSGQCDELDDGGPIGGPGCVTASIGCGDVIIGHTQGGVKRFDSRFYEAHFCTPRTTDHDGGNERIYRLEMPEGDWIAAVTLDTPCADLDLGALRWEGDDCPTAGHILNQCEMWPKSGTQRERVELVSQHRTAWLVVVEGKGEEEGAFSLTVQCRRGLH